MKTMHYSVAVAVAAPITVFFALALRKVVAARGCLRNLRAGDVVAMPSQCSRAVITSGEPLGYLVQLGPDPDWMMVMLVHSSCVWSIVFEVVMYNGTDFHVKKGVLSYSDLIALVDKPSFANCEMRGFADTGARHRMSCCARSGCASCTPFA